MSTTPIIHRTFHIGDVLKITECPGQQERVLLSICNETCFLSKTQFKAMADLAEYHSYSQCITWYTPEEQEQAKNDPPLPTPLAE